VRIGILLVIVVVVLTHAPVSAIARCDRDSCQFDELDLRISFPRSWQLSDHSPYPGVLVMAVQEERDGRMTLAAEEVPSYETAEAYLAKSHRALTRRRFKVGRVTIHPTGALVFDTESPRRGKALRQAYLLRNGVAYVLTLASPKQHMRSHLRAFDDTLRSMTFLPSAPGSTSAVAP
jgi:hypothetical protein